MIYRDDRRVIFNGPAERARFGRFGQIGGTIGSADRDLIAAAMEGVRRGRTWVRAVVLGPFAPSIADLEKEAREIEYFEELVRWMRRAADAMGPEEFGLLLDRWPDKLKALGFAVTGSARAATELAAGDVSGAAAAAPALGDLATIVKWGTIGAIALYLFVTFRRK